MRLHHNNLMSQVASIKVLGQAFAHVKHARIKAHYNDDIWHLSRKKDQVIARIRQSLSRMFQKVAWLYEQQASRKRLQAYLKRWQIWVNSQVGDLRFPIKFNSNPNPLKAIRISLSLTNQGYVLAL